MMEEVGIGLEALDTESFLDVLLDSPLVDRGFGFHDLDLNY
jgi:hypothetical protein